jgi:hypothetical protein
MTERQMQTNKNQTISTNRLDQPVTLPTYVRQVPENTLGRQADFPTLDISRALVP